MGFKLSCSHMTIYCENESEIYLRLSKLWNFLEIELNEKNKFYPYFLKSKSGQKEKYLKNNESILLGNREENSSSDIALDVSILDSKISIWITTYERNWCLPAQIDLLLSMLKENIVDLVYILRGLPRINPKWYQSHYESGFFMGKINFILLSILENKSNYKNTQIKKHLAMNWKQINKTDMVIKINQRQQLKFIFRTKKSLLDEIFKI